MHAEALSVLEALRKNPRVKAEIPPERLDNYRDHINARLQALDAVLPPPAQNTQPTAIYEAPERPAELAPADHTVIPEPITRQTEIQAPPAKRKQPEITVPDPQDIANMLFERSRLPAHLRHIFEAATLLGVTVATGEPAIGAATGTTATATIEAQTYIGKIRRGNFIHNLRIQREYCEFYMRQRLPGQQTPPKEKRRFRLENTIRRTLGLNTDTEIEPLDHKKLKRRIARAQRDNTDTHESTILGWTEEELNSLHESSSREYASAISHAHAILRWRNRWIGDLPLGWDQPEAAMQDLRDVEQVASMHPAQLEALSQYPDETVRTTARYILTGSLEAGKTTPDTLPERTLRGK